MSGKINVYEEIVAEFKKLIEVGVLKAGDKLPSVRSYAMERKVNPNTVAKAYTALEEEKVIEVLPKKGAYVIGTEGEQGSRKQAMKNQIVAIKRLGVTKQELLDMVEEIYSEGEKSI